jgi:short-subunit dehydrogenase
MSWPSSLWQSAYYTTKLYLLQWKKALTSASSNKDVRSLKLPPQEEIAQFIDQGNKCSVASTSTSPKDKKRSKKAKKACHSKSKSKEKQADDNSSHSSQDCLPAFSSSVFVHWSVVHWYFQCPTKD